eukprot:sb/3462275/
MGVIFDAKLTDDRLYTVSDDRALIVWDRHTGSIIHRLFGHSGRVLKVALLGRDRVMTCGEDNTVVVWRGGKEEERWTPHTGHGIRSVAVVAKGDVARGDVARGDVAKGSSIFTVVTGGWDGGIVSVVVDLEDRKRREYTLPCSTPKWVSWVREGELVIGDSDGTVKVHSPEIPPRTIISDFGSYSVFCQLDDVIVVGGVRGEICLVDKVDYTVERVNNENTSKVYSLTSLLPSSFLICQESGHLGLWGTEKGAATLSATFTLPPCKNRWVTAALELTGGRLLVGDRKGGLHLYKQGVMHPLASIRGLHGDNGVTQLTIMSPPDKVRSIGRDGVVRFLKITSNDQVVITGKERGIPGVNWLEHLTSDGTKAKYFKSDMFHFGIPATGQSLFSAHCGGSHRSWDMLISRNSCIYFAYINTSIVRVISESYRESSSLVLSPPSHGAEICDAVFTGPSTFTTASEDCTLISHSPSSVSRYSGHISSIRAVCLSPSFLFSAGGRGSVRAWSRSNMDLLSDYCLPSDTHLPVGYGCNYKFDMRTPESDQRVTSLCYIREEEGGVVLIGAGLSNGGVTIISFREGLNTFTPLKSEYFGNCITRVIGDPAAAGDNTAAAVVLCSTTFGMIHSLHISDNQTAATSYRAHQSGVNDLALIGQDFIVTIGDDGDITLGSLTSGVTTRRTVHFSAGIGVAQMAHDRVVTVGSDQRMCLISIPDLTILNCFYTDVQDPHRIVVRRMEGNYILEKKEEMNNGMRTEEVLIVGRGLQLFKISDLLHHLPMLPP